MKSLIARLLAALGRPGAPAGADPAPAAPTAGTNPELLRVARTILSIPAQRSSWNDYILSSGHHDEFIWTGQGEMVDQWNRLYGSGAGLADIEQDWQGDRDELIVFKYKERTLQVTNLQSRDNELLEVHTMNRLLQPDSEIRLCVDSLHHSDWAWFALPVAAWHAFEREFGADAVAYRFMTLPDDFATFMTEVITTSQDASDREYEDL